MEHSNLVVGVIEVWEGVGSGVGKDPTRPWVAILCGRTAARRLD